MSKSERLVDPMKLVNQRLAELARVAPVTVSHEIMLEPPTGAVVHNTTVAGSYREPIPIRYDFATRTAYPIRSQG